MFKNQPSTYLSIVILFTTLLVEAQKSNLQVEPHPIDAVEKDSLLMGPSVLNDPHRFIWGASVLKGNDEKYHMLYNTWHSGDSIPKFSDSWVLYSEIAYAVSDYPDRDFKFQKIVLKGRKAVGDTLAWDAQVVTNPHLKEFNGTYYLYYVGGRDPGNGPEIVKGQLNKRNRVQQTLRIGVIAFDSFEDLTFGNFRRPQNPLLAPRTRVKADNIVMPSPEGTVALPDNVIVVNPSVVYRETDGKYLMYFKGNLYDPHWRGVHGLALSDHPEGPFTPLDDFVFDFRQQDGRIASAEDPYVWYHKSTARFYAIVKDFSGKITGKEPGLALIISDNGLHWQKAEQPLFMKKQVGLISGETITLNRLERPQLLIDENDVPFVLYAAASIVNINPRTDGKSFNLQIPLKVEHDNMLLKKQ
ncbi:glycoside hydrolase family protein [Euzebyella saccharophila]|uniref:Glycoside hydrolase family protein n=1 Tax=Euzebyella saccharophila TaxID=679664 RepID=A0ABV8JP98_9FLAO|nr:glycoside hydrolase family protein [Euzebyella saccharophila]